MKHDYELGKTVLIGHMINMNLIGDAYVLQFAIEDVERMMVNGKRFQSIGIYVDCDNIQSRS